jgi:hypothetical protein
VPCMDAAKCGADGKQYYAKLFSEMSEADIAAKRQSLTCAVFHAPAFFRKESTLGQPPCFGARPHGKDCQFAAPETQSNDDPLGVEAEILQMT